LGADGKLSADLGGRRLNATVIAAAEQRHLFMDGRSLVLTLLDPLHQAGSAGATEGGLTAPMPGKVVALLAAVGESIAQGAPLLILEAMKMEHVITAPSAGKVKAFYYAAGEQVVDGAELVEFEAESEKA
jgi:3-methylcrotonyl-CoA carboxylase alpha subunit